MHQILSFIRNHRGPWLYMFWRRFYIWDKSILCWASSQFQIQYKDKSGLHFSIAVNIRTISIFSICLWKQQNWQFNSGTQNVTKIRTTKPKSLQKVFTHTNAKNATANGWAYWQARQLDGWYFCFVQLMTDVSFARAEMILHSCIYWQPDMGLFLSEIKRLIHTGCPKKMYQ